MGGMGRKGGGGEREGARKMGGVERDGEWKSRGSEKRGASAILLLYRLLLQPI